MRRGKLDRRRTPQHLRGQAVISHALRQHLRVWFADHHGVRGFESCDLLKQQVDLGRRRERKYFEPISMTRQHIQRVDADRAGGSEYRDAFHTGIAKLTSIIAAGMVGSNASTRSNMPPCPGKRPLLSLTLAARLTRDSTKSPTTAMVTK